MTKIKYLTYPQGRWSGALDYHRIILGIFIIGIINLYSIVKHGIIINLPTTITFSPHSSYSENIPYLSQSITSYSTVNHLSLPLSRENGEIYGEKGILIIDSNNVKIIAILTIVIYLIFQSPFHKLNSISSIYSTTIPTSGISPLLVKLGERGKEKVENISPTLWVGGARQEKKGEKWKGSIEYEILIGLGLIGLILIIISKEIISLYLGIEFYSFTTYVLVLVSPSINHLPISKFISSTHLTHSMNEWSGVNNRKSKLLGRVSIVYLILSSLASGIFLYGLNLIYSKYGIIDLNLIKNISFPSSPIQKISPQLAELGKRGGEISDYNNINIYIYILVIALLFKLGTVPFNNWLIRLYADLDKKILWYQLTLPKLVYFILLVKLIYLLPHSFNFENREDNLSINSSLCYILLIISILSILIGSLGGLYQNKDNLILAYSSILNMGNLILALSLILFNDYNLSSLFNPLPKLSYNNDWLLYNYIYIYIINLMGILSAIILFYNSSLVLNIKSLFSYPFLFISLLIIIFSFIGIPPFSGFFSKFYLIFSLSTNNLISLISIGILILSSVLSAYFYLKFLFSSISTTFLYPSISQKDMETFPNSLPSLILSFSTIFTLFYPLLVPYFLPLLITP